MPLPIDSPRINAESVFQTKDFPEPYLEKHIASLKMDDWLHAYRWDAAFEWKHLSNITAISTSAS